MTSNTSSLENLMPWTEKYRPRRLIDLLGNDGIRETLSAYAARCHLPNLMFVGPPGCGKTSAVACLENDMALPPGAVLRVNASDDRGLDMVRQVLKPFVGGKHITDNKPRIALLDEVEGMTPAAQLALKALMDRYQRRRVTFVLCCNAETGLHAGLVSRTVVLRFESVPHDIVQDRLRDISVREGLNLDSTQLAHIVHTAGGDLRAAVNALQIVADPDRTTPGFVDEEPVALSHAKETCHLEDLTRLLQAGHTAMLPQRVSSALGLSFPRCSQGMRPANGGNCLDETHERA